MTAEDQHVGGRKVVPVDHAPGLGSTLPTEGIGTGVGG